LFKNRRNRKSVAVAAATVLVVVVVVVVVMVVVVVVVVAVVVMGIAATATCMYMGTQSKPYTCTHLGFLEKSNLISFRELKKKGLHHMLIPLILL